MATKKLSGIISIIMIGIFISGCASDKAGEGRIIFGSAAVDLVNYVNQGILRIAELEQRSVERYESVIGENYTTDQRVYVELRDFVVPTYKRFLDGLRDIRPENEEVRKVHGIYIQGAEMMYDGFTTKMLGIENGNENIIIQGNEKIEKGSEEVKRWRLELIGLYKKHGVAEVGE